MFPLKDMQEAFEFWKEAHDGEDLDVAHVMTPIEALREDVLCEMVADVLYKEGDSTCLL